MSLDKDENGDVICFPLARFSTTTAFGMACFLSLGYARDDAELTRGLAGGELPSLQLALTPTQARQLARDLNKAADVAEGTPMGRPS